MTNTSSGESLQTFAVSIDSVEKITGIDFFPLLPDEQEEKIETAFCLTCWSWDSGKSKTGAKTSIKSNKSVQCSGTTKAGNRCKRMTSSPNGRCYQHGGN